LIIFPLLDCDGRSYQRIVLNHAAKGFKNYVWSGLLRIQCWTNSWHVFVVFSVPASLTEPTFFFAHLSIGGPFFGFWINRANALYPLLASTILIILGSISYSLSDAPWMVLLSRLVQGFGSGTILSSADGKTQEKEKNCRKQ
jgi:MFS family permease